MVSHQLEFSILLKESIQKIEDAPLQHIANAYGIFKKAEQLVTGRPTEIHGLMGYLMHLEKEDVEKANKEVVDITPMGECTDG